MTRLLSLALLAATLSAQTYDNNGALEAFYAPHAKTSWIRTGIRKSFRAVTGHGASRTASTNPLVGSPVRSTPEIKK